MSDDKNKPAESVPAKEDWDVDTLPPRETMPEKGVNKKVVKCDACQNPVQTMGELYSCPKCGHLQGRKR